MTQDPVCGMTIDEKKATAFVDHMGQRYYFCSEGCKKTFEKNPHKFIKK